MLPTIAIASSWLTQYGYLVLLPIAVVEGPIITVVAAFLASQGYFNVVIVYVIVVAGDLLGDLIYYAIGRIGKKKLVVRWGRKVGITGERIDRLESHFKDHGAKALLFGKLTHSVGWAVLAAAGIAEMPIGKFLWFNFLGTLPKSLFFLLIGYYFGFAYQQIDSYIAKISIIIFAAIVVGGIYFFFRKKYKSGEQL